MKARSDALANASKRLDIQERQLKNEIKETFIEYRLLLEKRQEALTQVRESYTSATDADARTHNIRNSPPLPPPPPPYTHTQLSDGLYKITTNFAIKFATGTNVILYSTVKSC
jgi:hypothetical protein